MSRTTRVQRRQGGKPASFRQGGRRRGLEIARRLRQMQTVECDERKKRDADFRLPLPRLRQGIPDA
ncbi:MAG TPA: hypothetical protein VEF36_13695, partial [Roseiarcus sp.]|nr:hypothetical protein [Roseiarcus sp.]